MAWIRQQINQVDVSDILILSSSVKVVESARDLGVIIDSQLSLSSHVAASFLPVWILSLEAATSTLSVTTSRSYKDTSTDVHFMSPGLLQLAAVWSDRQTHAASTVGAECCGKADHRSQTSPTHHTDEELNSRWPPWYTKCCQAKYLAIWPTIFISPQKFLLAPSGPLRGESALSLVFRVVLVTDVLLQLDHVSGTTYLPVCETRKSAAQNSEDN